MITVYGSLGMVSIQHHSGRRLYKPPAAMLNMFIEFGVPIRVMHYHLPISGTMSYWGWETSGIFIQRSDMQMQMHRLVTLQRFFRWVCASRRHLAVMMACHPRLGVASPLSSLPPDLVASIMQTQLADAAAL